MGPAFEGLRIKHARQRGVALTKGRSQDHPGIEAQPIAAQDYVNYPRICFCATMANSSPFGALPKESH